MEKLRNSVNKVEAIGTVNEYNLVVKQNTKKCFIDNEEREVKSAIIYGTVIITVNGDPIEFRVMTSKHKRNGEETKSFKGLCSIAGVKYENVNNEIVYSFCEDKRIIPSVQGTTTILKLGQKSSDNGVQKSVLNGSNSPSKVKISGSLDRNIYLNKDGTNVVVAKQLSASVISQETDNNEHCSYDVEGYVYEINNELDFNGNETGAKIISLANVGFFGVNMFEIKIPKEWESDGEKYTAEMYTDFCPVGKTITAHGEIECVTYGKKQNNSNSFGMKSHLTNGFKRAEWITYGADLTNEMESYKKEDIDSLVKEYEIFLDNEFNKRKKELEEKDMKQYESNSTGGLGRKSNVTNYEETEDDDCPF